ncbi:protein SPEAR1 [Prosopis cineraria]|uniref:protein SPEAR1 n=1 Tax=Prosopis cineraria TaxID=364024 RepID=UPI00240ED692|nr:protein SPEAR1 [Prosopis cineraria]
MGSSYFGDPNNNMMRNERANGISSSSSSRKGKKNSSDKPKQPQRGLGVAQLEKIRLHGQIACAYPPPHFHSPYNSVPSSSFTHEDPTLQTAYSSLPSSSSSYAASYGFHPNVVMGVPEFERTNVRYDSQPRSWDHSNPVSKTQPLAQSNVTRPFLNLYDSHHRSGSVRSSSQNSESSDNQELDLELRLSI